MPARPGAARPALVEDRLIKRGDEAKLLAFLVLQQGLFLAAGIGLWAWAGGSPGDFVRFGWLDGVIGVALAAGMSGAIALLFTALPSLGDRVVKEQARTIFSTERPYSFAAILVISFSAGIGEEALFRGGVQVLLGGWLPAWAAILAATALFTVAHPGTRTLMGFVAAIGLVLALAYHWSGSLLAVMIAHTLFDVFACLWNQRALRRLGHWDPAPPDRLVQSGASV